MQTNLNAPPTAWPQVTVGGKSYLMRYTQASLLLMQEWAIPIGKLNEWLNEEQTAGRGASAQLKVALATLGNFDSSGDWIPLCARPEVTAAKFVETEWATIVSKWPETLAKVAPPTKAPAQVAPGEGPVQ